MKKTLYILHGWAIDSENEKKWAEFREALLKKGVESKFLPIPGLSTKLDEVWTLDAYVSWLKSCLPEKETVFLLGHSFGGQIATQFSAQYPEFVEKLILVDSAGMIDKAFRKVMKRAIFGVLAKVGKRFIQHQFFRKLLYKMAREQDYFQANATQRQTMANVIATEIIDYLPQISCQTLIIWGEHDIATPIKFANAFHDGIKNSTLVVISGARHAPQFTHAEQTAKAVGEFLK